MKKTHIVIHHALMADGKLADWPEIRKFQTSWRRGDYMISPEEGLKAQLAGEAVTPPWREIAYHFGVELIGSSYEILLGRWLNEDGAHCKELKMNQVGIGICIVGNFDVEIPSSGIWNKAVVLVKHLVVEQDIPIENILGHGEVQKLAGLSFQKSCPGKLFSMDKFRTDVRASF
jgi:hypothetical protein